MSNRPAPVATTGAGPALPCTACTVPGRLYPSGWWCDTHQPARTRCHIVTGPPPPAGRP